MESGTYLIDDLEEPVHFKRQRVLLGLRAMRDRVRAASTPSAEDRERLAELAEEARAVGLHAAARAVEANP